MPDDRLRKIAEPVIKIDDEIKAIIKNMRDTLGADEKGVALAATQAGIDKRIVVFDVSEYPEEESPALKTAMINPEIVWLSDERSVMNEGCLSVPGLRLNVERPVRARVRYMDEDGNEKIIESGGFLGKCLQHEIDHLNGKTILDHVSKIKREMALKKIEKYKRAGNGDKS